MRCDIVVRAKDGHALTAACLQSIRSNTVGVDYRIILVDDGSSPALATADADYTVRCRESHGAVTATNLGLQVSLALDGDYVVVMDNDTEVPEGDSDWLLRFIGEYEQQPGTGVIGATTSFANPPQHILSVPQTYTADWDGEKTGGVKDNPEVVWFVSFCCLMSKGVVRRIGLWDERYNPGNYEDTDYAVAVRAAGLAVRVARSVYIHHKGHQTFGEKLKMLLETNKEKWLEKWGVGRLWDLGLVNDEAVAEVAAMAIRYKRGMK